MNPFLMHGPTVGELLNETPLKRVPEEVLGLLKTVTKERRLVKFFAESAADVRRLVRDRGSSREECETLARDMDELARRFSLACGAARVPEGLRSAVWNMVLTGEQPQRCVPQGFSENLRVDDVDLGGIAWDGQAAPFVHLAVDLVNASDDEIKDALNTVRRLIGVSRRKGGRDKNHAYVVAAAEIVVENLCCRRAVAGVPKELLNECRGAWDEFAASGKKGKYVWDSLRRTAAEKWGRTFTRRTADRHLDAWRQGRLVMKRELRLEDLRHVSDFDIPV